MSKFDIRISRRDLLVAGIGLAAGGGVLGYRWLVGSDHLDDLEEVYNFLPEGERQPYLERIKDEMKLEDFFYLKYYKNLEEGQREFPPLIRPGYAHAVVIPVTSQDEEFTSMDRVQWVMTGNNFYSPKYQNDMICFVFKEIFDLPFYDFLSAIADHEYKHADILKNGLWLEGREITFEDVEPLCGEDNTLANEMHVILSELLAYRYHLREGRFSKRMSPAFRHLSEMNYRYFFEQLQGLDPSGEKLPFLEEFKPENQGF